MNTLISPEETQRQSMPDKGRGAGKSGQDKLLAEMERLLLEVPDIVPTAKELILQAIEIQREEIGRGDE